MNQPSSIKDFLAGSPHAVVGASRDASKIGNRVFQVYLQTNRPAYPVNPSATQIEGHQVFPDLASLPQAVHGISVITPPTVSELIVEQAGALGIKHIWIQPGAESPRAVARASKLGMNVISGGPCILVTLGYRDRRSPVM